MKQTASSFQINIIFIVAAIIGLLCLPLLSIKLNPSKTLPSLTISSYWPNASPEIVERNITTTYEAAFSTINGVANIESQSGFGSSQITLEFEKDVSLDAKRLEVSTLCRAIYSKLPEGVTRPHIVANMPDSDAEQQLLSYTLNGPDVQLNIHRYARRHIQTRLSNLPNVHSIKTTGALPFRWEIMYKQQLIQQLGIHITDIRNAINQYLQHQELGRTLLNEREGKLQLRVGSHFTIDQLKQIPVKKVNQRIVRLGDISNITHKEEQASYYFRINGLNSVSISIYANKDANSLKLAKIVKEEMAHIESELPAGYQLIPAYDATEYISRELNKIAWRSFLSITVLLLFVLLIARSFRYLFIVAVSIFVNLIIAVIFYYILKVEIQLYSLAGITVSLGIIIDNSIVMIDHLRHKKNKKVFLAILAATLTTIGALSIIFFLDERVRLNLIDFTLVMMINLVVSLFVALFFIPAILDKIPLKNNQKKIRKRKRRVIWFNRKYIRIITFTKRFKWILIPMFVLGFGLPVHKLPDTIESETKLAHLYNKTFGSDYFNSSLKPALSKIMGGSLRLFTEFVFEQNYYYSNEQTRLFLRMYMPDGATLEQANQVMKQFEQFLSGFSEIDQFHTRIQSTDNAGISIYFTKNAEKSAFPYSLKSMLETKAIQITGADFSIYGVGRGFSNRLYPGFTNSQIILSGYNYEQLLRYAKELKGTLLENPRIQEVFIKSGNSWMVKLKKQFVLNWDSEQQLLYSIPLHDFVNAMETFAIGDQSINRIHYNGYFENIALVSSNNSSADLYRLNHMPMQTGETTLRFKNIGQIKQEFVDEEIYKKNQEYKVVVAYDFIGPGKLATRIMEQERDKINKVLPIGYKASLRDYSGWWNETDTTRVWMILLVIMIILFICAILLESLLQPLAIISMIPFSFIGVFLTFYLFDINFDQGGFASFILLSGLVVNSALYIVNDFNNNQKSNKALLPKRMYIKAYNTKVIPIFLTLISTVLGLVPFMVMGQSEVFWYSLAAGTIGGIIFSAIGLLFVLPLFLNLSTQKPKTTK